MKKPGKSLQVASLYFSEFTAGYFRYDMRRYVGGPFYAPLMDGALRLIPLCASISFMA